MHVRRQGKIWKVFDDENKRIAYGVGKPNLAALPERVREALKQEGKQDEIHDDNGSGYRAEADPAEE